MEYNNDVLQMVHSCTRIFCMYVSLKRFNVFLENSWRVESARQMFSLYVRSKHSQRVSLKIQTVKMIFIPYLQVFSRVT